MIDFNEDRDVAPAHENAALSRVLHVFDCNWHGIRAATSCLPGGKLGISHKEPPTGDEIRHIQGLIFHHGFRAICYQGYSECADSLAAILHKDFGSDIRQYVVSHVAAPQFEHVFEMQMLRRIYDKLEKGVLVRAGSVKPDFHEFLDKTWRHCIFNLPPNVEKMRLALPEREFGTVFIPVENTWRKNLYTQIIAAHASKDVDRIIVVNWPSHLEELLPLHKVQMIGFQTLPGLLAHMRLSEIACNVSLTECQPMTQLEALVMGTPALVNRLNVPVFSRHALSELTEVDAPDDPGVIRSKLDDLLEYSRREPQALSEMIADFLRMRTAAGLNSYCEFLEV